MRRICGEYSSKPSSVFVVVLAILESAEVLVSAKIGLTIENKRMMVSNVINLYRKCFNMK